MTSDTRALPSDFCVAGVDVGSTLTKVVIYDGDLLATLTGPTEADYAQAAARLLGEALERAGRSSDHLAYVMATGYGRRRLAFADSQITEITCHARGVRAKFPDARTIIDVGGQDAKGIKLSPTGKVVNFVMNDKCAAGTGRFLDVMAQMLGLTIDQLGELASRATSRVSISSVCTVFAQQEIAQRLAEGVPLDEVLAGLHAALASRIDRMVRRLQVEREVILTGGGAKNPTLVRFLEERLGISVIVPSDPLVTGALGAALLAREAIERGEPRRTAQRLDTRGLEGGSVAKRASPAGSGRAGVASVRAGLGTRSLEGRFVLPANGTAALPATAGLDVGSLYTKAVVVDGNRATFAILPSQGTYVGVAEGALARALRSSGIAREDLAGFVATGLGAPKLSSARQVNDISCLAKGFSRLCPEVALLIDIGGQATRVIRLGSKGLVKDFAVSGQCAAGSARLLDVIAHLLGTEVGELGELSLRSEHPVTFSAGCAVFAETEAISLLAQGTSREDLLAGVHQSLAGKILALTRGVGPFGTCALTGGGARDQGLVARLAAAMDRVVIPPEPMAVQALGAALLGAENP